MSKVILVNPSFPLATHIQQAVTVLRRGGIVAFPTETVYGLGADALEPKAVEKIFRAKGRPAWDPLIVHVRDLDMAKTLAAELPPVFHTLASQFWPGPLTLLVEKSAKVPDAVTAGRSKVALRMPKHPVAAALLAEFSRPIAAPSANKFGRSSPTRAEHVVEDLGKEVEIILDGGPTTVGVESTVLDITQSPPAILRPGGITREQLEKAIGPVTLAPSVADELARQGLAGPGMTPSHYAPRARLELFEGDRDTVINQMAARAIELRNRDHRVGAIVSDEMLPFLNPVVEMASSFGPWGEWDKMAKRLFAAFRVFDSMNMVVILCFMPPAEGIGLAIRDRLQRAATLKKTS